MTKRVYKITVEALVELDDKVEVLEEVTDDLKPGDIESFRLGTLEVAPILCYYHLNNHVSICRFKDKIFSAADLDRIRIVKYERTIQPFKPEEF